MNQHQRKFLLEAIEKQYKIEREKLLELEPTEPSLNNYLIASILDGSFKLKPSDEIRESFRDRVKNLGKNESLIESSDSNWRYSRNKKDDESIVHMPAEVIFELPPDYVIALNNYNKDLSSWNDKLSALEASIGAMRIKVQVGSDKSLESLVEQADAICSMSLTAANKIISGGNTKRLGE